MVLLLKIIIILMYLICFIGVIVLYCSLVEDMKDKDDTLHIKELSDLPDAEK